MEDANLKGVKCKIASKEDECSIFWGDCHEDDLTFVDDYSLASDTSN